MPFHTQGPVGDEHFVGRKVLLAQTLARLQGERGDNLAIQGDPATGKTSFLRRLKVGVQHQGCGEHRVWASASDLGTMPRDSTPSMFWRQVLAELGECEHSEIRERFRDLEMTDFSQHQVRRFARSTGRHHRIVLFLDSFDHLLVMPKLHNDTFVGQLRSLLSMPGAPKLVVGTAMTISKMARLSRSALHDSPWANIFSGYRLGPFTEEETLELLTGEPGTASYQNMIRKLAGGHPSLIQLCGQAFAECQARYDDKTTIVREARRLFHERSKAPWERQWRYWTPATRKMVINTVLRSKGQNLGKREPVDEGEDLDSMVQLVHRIASSRSTREIVTLTKRTVGDHSRTEISGDWSPARAAQRLVDMAVQTGALEDLKRSVASERPPTHLLGGGSIKGLREGGFVDVHGHPAIQSMVWWVADELGRVVRGDLSLDSWRNEHELSGSTTRTLATQWLEAANNLDWGDGADNMVENWE